MQHCDNNPTDASKKCCCPCHRMGAAFIILLGLGFLLKNLGVISDQMMNIAWPVLIMLVGLKKLTKGMCKCCKKS